MKITKGLLLILSFLWVFGCTPARETHPPVGPPVGPRAPVKHTSLFPSGILDQKVALLEDRLEDKDISEKDKALASKLLTTYKTLKKLSAYDLTEKEYREVIQRLFENLTLLDENLMVKEKTGAKDIVKAMMDFSKKRREILDSYLTEDYRGVINRSMALKSISGSDALTREIGLVYALSLAKEGLVEEAVSVGEGVVNQSEATPGLTDLRIKMAEWKLRLGQQERASSIYTGLKDKADKNETALALLHKKILAGKSPVTRAPVMTEKEGVPGGAAVQMQQLFQKVDRLIQEQKFEKARELLSFRRSELLLEIAPVRAIETVDRALKEVDLAEEGHLQEKISKLSKDFRKRETMELAMKLLEEEKFEEAISTLDSLDSEQKESPGAKRLNALAVEMLINRERNRAAKIFLQAKKTHDPTKKKEYLLSSYNILKVIVDKYPSSPLILKVKSHIEVVRKELDKLPGDT